MGIGGDQSGSIRVVCRHSFMTTCRRLIHACLPASITFRYCWHEADVWVDSYDGCDQYRGGEGYHRSVIPPRNMVFNLDSYPQAP